MHSAPHCQKLKRKIIFASKIVIIHESDHSLRTYLSLNCSEIPSFIEPKSWNSYLQEILELESNFLRVYYNITQSTPNLNNIIWNSELKLPEAEEWQWDCQKYSAVYTQLVTMSVADYRINSSCIPSFQIHIIWK